MLLPFLCSTIIKFLISEPCGRKYIKMEFNLKPRRVWPTVKQKEEEGEKKTAKPDGDK